MYHYISPTSTATGQAVNATIVIEGLEELVEALLAA
jgi:hypothetical protein